MIALQSEPGRAEHKTEEDAQKKEKEELPSLTYSATRSLARSPAHTVTRYLLLRPLSFPFSNDSKLRLGQKQQNSIEPRRRENPELWDAPGDGSRGHRGRLGRAERFLHVDKQAAEQLASGRGSGRQLDGGSGQEEDEVVVVVGGGEVGVGGAEEFGRDHLKKAAQTSKKPAAASLLHKPRWYNRVVLLRTGIIAGIDKDDGGGEGDGGRNWIRGQKGPNESSNEQKCTTCAQ